jgi:hypothetical protein
VTGLGVVGWFLGGQKSTRAGQFFEGDFFNRVFELPSPRNAQKREKVGFGFFVDFFVKTFFVAFLNSHR